MKVSLNDLKLSCRLVTEFFCFISIQYKHTSTYYEYRWQDRVSLVISLHIHFWGHRTIF